MKDSFTLPDLYVRIVSKLTLSAQMGANMDMKHQENAKVFKAFCDEKRLAILALLQSGEKCACVLIDEMKIGQSSLSYHMKILCESGVVDSRQEGKWTHYRLSESGSKFAVDLLIKLTTSNFN